MRFIVAALIRPFCVLALLLFFASPLYADPVILLAPANAQNPVPWPTDPVTGLPKSVTFTTNPDGSVGQVTFVNNTKFVFTDFHFTFPVQRAIGSGNRSKFFGSTDGNSSSVDFFNDPEELPGTGIQIGDTFSIEMTGFNGVTNIIGTPTFVPEPATLLLLGSGLTGLAMKSRKRLKHRKSG